MRRNRFLLRISAFILALFLAVGTPVGDYIHTRNTVTSYAMGAVFGSAAQWIWAAAIAACGITLTSSGAIDALSSAIEDYNFQNKANKKAMASVRNAILKATWDSTFDHFEKLVGLCKQFFASVTGYGSKNGLESIEGISGKYRSFEESYGYNFNGVNLYEKTDVLGYVASGGNTYGFSIDYDAYGTHYYEDYWFDFSSRVGGYIHDPILNITPCNMLGMSSGSGYSMTQVSSIVAFHVDINTIPFPVFASKADYINYMDTGDYSACINGYDGSLEANYVIPVTSVPDVQARPIQQVGDLRVPATADEAQNQYTAITDAVTSVDLVGALAPSVDITYGAADYGKEDTYPWIPDITGALDAIRDVINSVKVQIGTIPDVLSGIGDRIIALPDTISKAISDALVGEKEETKKKLELPSVLADKFPFCVPFDLYAIVTVLSAPPVAPRFEIPFEIDYASIKYNHVFVIDMSAFESVIAIFRVMEIIMFLIGLSMITRNIIRG